MGRPRRRDYAKLDGRALARLAKGPATLSELREAVGCVPYHSKLRNRLATLVARGVIEHQGTTFQLPQRGA